MSNQRTITTKGAERWDNISQEQYGSPLLYSRIIEANPDVPVYDVIPAGTTLFVPVLTEDEIHKVNQVKSPWTVK